jgi:flavin reductase (DIM6/NTAB) family NADH-FMN oxidoreductase RutF
MHRLDFEKRRDIPSVDPEGFRVALRHFASGVTIVTANHEGTIHGITVSAFTSISLEPPIVMVAINNVSPLRQIILDSEHYAVHILSTDQQRLSSTFAASIPGSEKYGELVVEMGISGAPRIAGALAVLECVMVQSLEVGTHTLMFGRVVESSAQLEPGSPLIYYHRNYWRLADKLEPDVSEAQRDDSA